MGLNFGTLVQAALGGSAAYSSGKREAQARASRAAELKAEKAAKAAEEENRFYLDILDRGGNPEDFGLAPRAQAQGTPNSAPEFDWNNSKDGRAFSAKKKLDASETEREITEATAVIMTMTDPDTGQPYTEGKAKAFGMAGRSGISMAASQNRDPTGKAALADKNADRRDLMAFGASMRQPSQGSDPNWQVVQTDNGVMQINPKTGETRAVNAPDGTQMRPKMSGAMQEKVATNKGTSQTITNALGALANNRQAVGLKRGHIDRLDQLFDPKGVDARALIANVGSQIIHLRSGAAVTISEAPRLRPFVPNVTDSPEAIVKKLRRLRQAVDDENSFLTEPARPSGGSSPRGRSPAQILLDNGIK